MLVYSTGIRWPLTMPGSRRFTSGVWCINSLRIDCSTACGSSLVWPTIVTAQDRQLPAPNTSTETQMAKAYVIVMYRSSPEPTSFAQYGELAIPAVQEG